MPEVLSIFLSALNLGRAADIHKREVFYGKQRKKPLEQKSFPETKPKLMLERLNTVGGIRFMHGIIGKITEIGELCEALFKAAEEGSYDPTNVLEEIGDDDWYNQIICSVFGVTLDEVQAHNWEKLGKVRYPNGFTEKDANNRDLGKERKALQKALENQPPEQIHSH